MGRGPHASAGALSREFKTLAANDNCRFSAINSPPQRNLPEQQEISVQAETEHRIATAECPESDPFAGMIEEQKRAIEQRETDRQRNGPENDIEL
jgi:hypothetical protein